MRCSFNVNREQKRYRLLNYDRLVLCEQAPALLVIQLRWIVMKALLFVLTTALVIYEYQASRSHGIGSDQTPPGHRSGYPAPSGGGSHVKRFLTDLSPPPRKISSVPPGQGIVTAPTPLKGEYVCGGGRCRLRAGEGGTQCPDCQIPINNYLVL